MSAVIENKPLTPVNIQTAVIPWFVEKDKLPADMLSRLYRRLVAEDMIEDLVPENKITEREFIEFLDSPNTLLYLFLDIPSGRFAGLAWLANIEVGDCVKKAAASVAIFPEYRNPKFAHELGRKVLSHWFNILGFDVIYGITPATNKRAQRYTVSVGFTYEARLKDFMSRRGQVCDARIAVIRKADFNGQGSK